MYTLIFRKGAVELEFTTSDKSIIERQLSKIISQASNKVVHSQTSINEQTQEQKLNIKDKVKEILNLLKTNSSVWEIKNNQLHFDNNQMYHK